VSGPTSDVAVGPLVAPEGSTLVLVPSAHDAQRVAASLRDEGRDVVRMGADRSARELTEAWCRARLGACVVVGGRTAAWAPVPDLASVIVLDDLDEAFDDERAPTWNARDVAIERARRVRATLRIVSPAPSVEALVALGDPPGSTSGRARHGWPRVDVVDVREQEPGQALVTRELADALHQTLDADTRAVCVLNRRGRSRLLACRTCRELARCERCGATVRDDGAALVCAVCATTRPSVCLHCHATRFRPVKPGVAHVRDDLAALLPRVEVGVVDAATDEVPDAPVLVGTEAVLHRVGPRAGSPADRPIGLVAYLELDQELLAPRVRAAEQALWLLVRGARVLTPQMPTTGTASRMLIETRMPDHEVVRAAVTGETLAVTRAERARREELGFPPFGGVAALRGEVEAITAACDALRTVSNHVEVLGPVDSGRRALVRARSWITLADALATPAMDAAHALGRLRIDVDPRRD
jgi:primosomal protein N' (replication factor Y)